MSKDSLLLPSQPVQPGGQHQSGSPGQYPSPPPSEHSGQCQTVTQVSAAPGSVDNIKKSRFRSYFYKDGNLFVGFLFLSVAVIVLPKAAAQVHPQHAYQEAVCPPLSHRV